MSDRKKLLIIDGNSILNRAFYGVRPMTTKDGRPTNAIYGFINMILKPLESLSPDAAAIAFDLKAPTFRHKKCDFYKANRKGMPEELAAQLDGAKKAAKCLGLHILSLEGYEADDILGTASKLAETDSKTDYDCYIMTGDRDSFQLVGEKSFVLLCTNSDTVLYDKEKISEIYGGLCPSQLIDLKALMGDSSDNIPGVAGIGEKTAVKLISEFSDLDNLYENFENSSLSNGIKEKLKKDREMAYTSRFLAEIYREVPLPLAFSDLSYPGIDKTALYELLSSYELRSIIKRLNLLPQAPAVQAAENSAAVSLFDSDEESEAFGGTACATAEVFCGFTEESKVPPLDFKEIAVYTDISENKMYIDPDGIGNMYIVPLTPDNLKGVFSKENLLCIVYDSKEIYRLLLQSGIEEKCSFFDVLLAEYVVSPSAKGGIEDILAGKITAGFDISDKVQKNLLCTRLLFTEKKELEVRLEKDGLCGIFYDMEMPLAKTLAKTEHEGFLIDTDGLFKYGEVLDLRLSERIANIYELSGCTFNINSPKQLGDVLYNTLSLPAFKKTKSGFSTDAETLEKLRPYHPIINEILDYRVVAKLKSTYVEGLLKVCNPDTKKVHTTFKQALTATGRLSSVEPNLQNIPIKQAEGRELRKFFVASAGNILVDADYSQIELRILAALAGDKTMCDAFKNGIDIHTMTASQVFGVSQDKVTSEMRKSAKAVNFGIVYGISDFSLAGDIGTTRKQAGEYIEKYFAKYPGIREFLDAQIDFATQKGYVTTLFGRRRYIPELTAKNKVMQAFGKRVAMNSPIQGSAADIIKLAMIRTEKALENAGLSAKIILQVHDELIVECPENEKDRVCEILRFEMEHCVSEDFPVPLEVSLSCGKTWYDAHG
ncbi:MAG: DNA polymerase I [Ruminococcaceae bacterium]|nr:DNA polymerase I [Oscillospiraceae bacterium]